MVIFDLTQPVENVHIYHSVTWPPTCSARDRGALLRAQGRLEPRAEPALRVQDAAWPFIARLGPEARCRHRTIRTRLRHGYQVVEREPAP